jgi:hypothetical protein
MKEPFHQIALHTENKTLKSSRGKEEVEIGDGGTGGGGRGERGEGGKDPEREFYSLQSVGVSAQYLYRPGGLKSE